MPMRLDFFVKLKNCSSTIILSVSIKYSLRNLLFDVNNYMPHLQSSNMIVMRNVAALAVFNTNYDS